MALTWADVLKDDSIPIHWLLVLSPDGGTTTYRYAEGCVDIGNTYYAGALRVDTAPTLDYDPYTGRASAGQVQITLLPLPDDPFKASPMYPKDLEALHTTPWIGWTAKLYLWGEGADLDTQLRIDGNCRNAVVNPDGSVTMTILDKSVRWDRSLPACYIDTRRSEYAACDPDEAGMGIPINYGPLQSRCVRSVIASGSSDWVTIQQGKTHTLSALYAGTTAQTVAGVITGPDSSHGVPITSAEVAVLADGTVTAWGSGACDDVSGTYTGTANSFIVHLIQQLHSLACQECEIPAADVDTTAIATLVSQVGSPAGTLNGLIRVEPNEKTTFWRIAEEVGNVCRSFIGVEHGKLTMKLLNFTASPVMNLADGVNVRKIIGLRRNEDTNLATKVVMRGAYYYATSDESWDYRVAVEWDDTDDAQLATTLTLLGAPQQLDIDTKVLADAAAVLWSAAAKATLHGRQRHIVELEADRSTHDLHICDIVHLTTPLGPHATGAGWTDSHFAVIGIKYGTDVNTLTLLET